MTNLSGSTADLDDSPAFEAFLSHRYASAEVNLYFYRIFTPSSARSSSKSTRVRKPSA